MRPAITLIVAVTATLAATCGGGESSGPVPRPRLLQEPFGRTAGGAAVDLITLRNTAGMEIRLMTYGGTILSIQAPDREGATGDVVLGFDTLEPYFDRSPYFGSLIGRYGNRIARGQFMLDGAEYQLATNNDPNHLHGGVKGWDKVVWTPDPFQDAAGVGVRLRHVSPDGEEGYPGAVTAEVTYRLTDDNRLVVEYVATTDKPTIINLTQHSYFNLAGTRANDILGHELTINADRYTPVDATLIPTGALAPVEGTPFDFRQSTAIGARIGQDNEQLTFGLGYDHNFVLSRAGNGLTTAATVYEPLTGRTLEITTTEPGLQFYSGNFLDGTITGKGGRVYGHRAGFCLETQHFPDSPNHDHFPSTVLRPGEEYRSQTVFRFGAE
jgi:aldose 1-epimerase